MPVRFKANIKITGHDLNAIMRQVDRISARNRVALGVSGFKDREPNWGRVLTGRDALRMLKQHGVSINPKMSKTQIQQQIEDGFKAKYGSLADIELTNAIVNYATQQEARGRRMKTYIV